MKNTSHADFIFVLGVLAAAQVYCYHQQGRCITQLNALCLRKSCPIANSTEIATVACGLVKVNGQWWVLISHPVQL